MLSCMSGCAGRAGPTSSRVSMADPGVVAAVLTVVLGAVPDELTESISPATSWISRAKMAKSLAKSWLILRTQGNNLLIRQGSLGLRRCFKVQMNQKISDDRYLAISSLWAVQSLMYSSCSFMRCLMPTPPGIAATPAGPELVAELSLEPRCGTRWWGRTWGRAPCFAEFRLEPNSSSEVEPYSGGRRLHLLLLDTATAGKAVTSHWTKSQWLLTHLSARYKWMLFRSLRTLSYYLLF